MTQKQDILDSLSNLQGKINAIGERIEELPLYKNISSKKDIKDFILSHPIVSACIGVALLLSIIVVLRLIFSKKN